MSRQGRRDVVVVGGGVVGAAAALMLARNGLDVVLVEAREPEQWSPRQPDLRVYAIAPDNAALLDGLGVWGQVCSARLQPYRRMRVWDAGGPGELVFDADTLGRRELGWIVEHGLLVDRLWAALPGAGVQVQAPAAITGLEQLEDHVRLEMADGVRLQARLAIAADGARSTLRRLAGIEVDASDYGQRGIVAYVQSEQAHEATAWQRFLVGGPLAVLPVPGLQDPPGATTDAGRTSSIVWTRPRGEAERLLALEDARFSSELTRAFECRLGAMRVCSSRAAFPLSRQLVRAACAGRVLVMGDAAHVVHPLAGQGVNLGLRDVAALGESIRGALAKSSAWDASARLERWARQRRSENAMAAHAFDAINRIFSNDNVAAAMLRGPLLGLAGRLPPLGHALWRRAAGV